MHIPRTYLSLHDITGLSASVGYQLDSPLQLTVDSEHGSVQITLFLSTLLTPDQIKALADTLNAATVKAEPAAASPLTPEEKAAYAAADGYWARLKLDLDRGLITPLKIVAADNDDAGVVYVHQGSER
jgi:hypothetical protein